MSQPKILIVDDDAELTELVRNFLERNGYQVYQHHSGDGVAELVTQYKPDLILLDLMLPKVDGISICKSIRKSFKGAIIMLTALNEDIDEVTGLEVGADDYLSKPVKPQVLVAHIRAQLRQKERWASQQQSDILTAHNQQLVIDGGKRTIVLNGDIIEMSSAEFDLLWELGLHCGKTVPRNDLYKKIFRLEHDGIDRSIDLRISRIRKKLGDAPKSPQIIKTIRNKGYLLAN